MVMTRKNAEHILDAYAAMTACDFDEKAIAALREVILDAMTDCTVTVSSTTVPNQIGGATWGNTTPHNPVTGAPMVTCGTEAR